MSNPTTNEEDISFLNNDMVKSLNPNMIKVMSKLDSIKNKVNDYKKNMDELSSEMKLLEKLLTKVAKKQIKSSNTSKKPRKLCGFALPSQVSDELCDFMKMPHGTLISRTDVTKYLMKYISENQLQNPQQKKFIVPNETLWKLIGEEARDMQITHFTIQKYINKHFIKNK